MTIQTIQCEVMLLNWSQTHNGGSKIVLQLADDDALELFKALTVKKGNHAGQRMMAVFAEIGDNELPVGIQITVETEPPAVVEKPKRKNNSRFPDGLCGLAVKWSNDGHFLEWMWAQHGDVAYAVNEALPEQAAVEELAAGFIRKLCNIESRKELDANEGARELFNTLIRVPYSEHRKQAGLA